MTHMFLILNILLSLRRESSLKPHVSLTWFSQPWSAQKDRSPVALKPTTISFILPVNLQVIQPTSLSQGVHTAPTLTASFPSLTHFTNAESLENFWRRQDLRVASGPSSVGGVGALTAPSAIRELLCLLIFVVSLASLARWVRFEAERHLEWNTDYHHLLEWRALFLSGRHRTCKVAGRQLESLQFLETQVTWDDAEDDLSPAIFVISVWCVRALSHNLENRGIKWSSFCLHCHLCFYFAYTSQVFRARRHLRKK